MLKLYKFTDAKNEYWETWDNGNGTHVIHWGELGTKGESKQIKGSFLKRAEKIVQGEIDKQIKMGFNPVESEFTILIEFLVDGFGTEADLAKRHRLESRMNETLGWTGLGHCDGGSVGSGTMEVANYVVDIETAKRVIAEDLIETEFQNYSRIYCEELE